LSVDGIAVGSDTSYPYEFSWDTLRYSNGTHVLKASATDTSGNMASTAGLTVLVYNAQDTDPPVVSIVSPGNGSKIKTSVSVQVNATDNVRVSKVELYVDGVLTDVSNTAPFTIKWSARNLSKGAHQMQCKAFDSAENEATSNAVTVYK